MVHETLFHLFLSAAEIFSMKNKLPLLVDETTHFIRDLENTFKMQIPEACTTVCQEIRLSSSLLSTMKKFKHTGREQSATFRYWISFLDAGDTLLKLLWADREAVLKCTLPPSLNSYRTSSWQAVATMHDTSQSMLRRCVTWRFQLHECFSTCRKVVLL